MSGATHPDPLLALETSGSVGSLAVTRAGSVVSRVFLTDARSHASGILGALERCLADAGLAPRDLAALVVGAGPGSFTGVRIAAATAKGLAHALGLPLYAISSLAAAAVSDLALPPGAGPAGGWPPPSPDPTGPRCVLFDARGGRVYAAAYRAWEGGLEEVIAPRATGIGEVLADPLPERVSFAGDGALAHRDRIERAGFEVLGPPAGIPTADGLIRLMGDPRWGRPLSDQAEWEPDYLRASNAERERGA